MERDMMTFAYNTVKEETPKIKSVGYVIIKLSPDVLREKITMIVIGLAC